MLCFSSFETSSKEVAGRAIFPFRSAPCFIMVFCLFTGLSPSVVRSVSMFSVLAIAELFGRQSLTLNTLAATAWVMLLVNPAWLFDVGFQLSFLAVLSILMIQKPVYQLLPVKSRIGNMFGD